MAHFYGEISSKSPRGGKQNSVTRMGDKSGMIAHVRGWNVGARVTLSVDADGNDTVHVEATPGSSGEKNGERSKHLVTFRKMPTECFSSIADQHEAALEACRKAVEWARTPQDHGGNPWCKEFVQLANEVLTGSKFG